MWLKEKLTTFFDKGVILLSGGTIISQAIVFFTSPILSRIYPPASFGLLSLFTSVSVVLACLSTGKYELAIFVPRGDRAALNIIRGIFILSLTLALVISVPVILFNPQLAELLKFGKGYTIVLYFVPFTIIQIATLSCLQLWLQRLQLYHFNSIAVIAQSCITVLSSVVLSYVNIHLGLIFGYILGQIICVIIIVMLLKRYSFLKELSLYTSTKKTTVQMLRYAKYPKFVLPSELLMVIGQQFLPILYSILYSTNIVGFISFGVRILRVPSIVLASSFWGVYRNDISKRKADGLEIYSTFTTTLKKLIILALLPFTVLALSAPLIFELVFGKQWVEAGEYARMLCLLLFTEFIAYPLTNTFLVLKKEKAYFVFQFLNISFGILVIVLGKLLFNNAKISLMLYAVTGSLINITMIWYASKLAKK